MNAAVISSLSSPRAAAGPRVSLYHSKRLAISLAAALAAFVGNHLYLAGQLRREPFVAVARDVRPGQPIVEEDLHPIEISGDLGAFRKSAIPWDERAVLFERQAARGLVGGDIVLW